MSLFAVVLGVTFLALGVGGVTLSLRWIRRLAGWLPRRAFLLHLAAGPFMVLGTIPMVLAFWAWRARVAERFTDPIVAAAGALGVEVWILSALGGGLWLGGLWCLVEGHRLARSHAPPSPQGEG